MSEPEIFRIDDDRLLCDVWHAPSHTVVLRPGDPRRRLHPAAVAGVVNELAARGVERILTAALDAASLEPFADAGFTPHEDLCVLRHDLGSRPRTTSDRRGRTRPGPTRPGSSRPDTTRRGSTRRGSMRRDLARAAAVDQRAFSTGFALDRNGLEAIVSATPACRFRLVAGGPAGSVAAYALCGLAGDTGYVQRVAVDPACRRNGHARALLGDALDWFDRRRAARVLVNTQVTNLAAQQLYLGVGFTRTADRLAVWSWRREVAR